MPKFKMPKFKKNKSKKAQDTISDDATRNQKTAQRKRRTEEDKSKRKMEDQDLESILSTSEMTKDATMSFLSKTLGKRIPLAGIGISMDEIQQKLDKGDYKGAVMSTASMVASQFPGIGTASSVAIDIYLSIDEKNAELDGVEEEARFYTEKEARLKGIDNFENHKITILSEEDVKELSNDIKYQEEVQKREQTNNKVNPKSSSSNIILMGGAATVLTPIVREAIELAERKRQDPKAGEEKVKAMKGIFSQNFGRDKEGKKDEKVNEALGMGNPGMGEAIHQESQKVKTAQNETLHNSRLKV